MTTEQEELHDEIEKLARENAQLQQRLIALRSKLDSSQNEDPRHFIYIRTPKAVINHGEYVYDEDGSVKTHMHRVGVITARKDGEAVKIAASLCSPHDQFIAKKGKLKAKMRLEGDPNVKANHCDLWHPSEIENLTVFDVLDDLLLFGAYPHYNPHRYDPSDFQSADQTLRTMLKYALDPKDRSPKEIKQADKAISV